MTIDSDNIDNSDNIDSSDNIDKSGSGDSAWDQLLENLVQVQHDVLTLAHQRGVTARELVDLARRMGARDAMMSLSSLADAQAQLYLSRCRLLAANRLANLLAGACEDVKDRDLVRKTCVDILRARIRVDAADLGDNGADLVDFLTEAQREPTDEAQAPSEAGEPGDDQAL